MPDILTQVHTPVYLQNVSLGFRNYEMIADRVAPRIPVANQSNYYRVWGKNNLVVHEARWSPGTIPNAIDIRWSNDTYFAEIRKLRALLLDSELRNADSDLRLASNYTEIVTNAIAIARENRVATLFTTAANYPAGNVITKAGGSEWDVAPGTGGIQPLTDLYTLVATVASAAMVPTTALTVVIPQPVWLTALWNNAALIGRVQYVGGFVTTELLARLLQVKEVIMASSMSAGPGPETAGSDVITGYPTSFLWGDTVWVGLVNAGQNDMVPSFARSFNWTAETGGQERQIRRYRAEDEGREADWIECKEAIGEKIVYSAAGGVIKNTLSTI